MDKEILTAEQIVDIAEKVARTDTNRAIRRQINKLFRAQDDSHKSPVRGKFSVIERAIRRLRRMESESGVGMEPLEYALSIELQTSIIVNREINGNGNN